MLTASVHISLDHRSPDGHQFAGNAYDLCRLDRWAIERMDKIPDGSQVQLDVGSRTFVTPDVAKMLATQADRLKVEISGSTLDATWHWFEAIKTRGASVL